jgi:hypothetical protein
MKDDKANSWQSLSLLSMMWAHLVLAKIVAPSWCPCFSTITSGSGTAVTVSFGNKCWWSAAGRNSIVTLPFSTFLVSAVAGNASYKTHYACIGLRVDQEHHYELFSHSVVCAWEQPYHYLESSVWRVLVSSYIFSSKIEVWPAMRQW